VKTLAPEAVKAAITAVAKSAQGEFALVDVREFGQFGEGHPFFSVNIPFSRLELDVSALLPSLGTPIVLLDDDDGVADKACTALKGLGYRDLSRLAGGAPGWAAAGFELFEGVNLPSKAFGELVEHGLDTPRLDARTLRTKLDANEDLIVLDGRTPAEFRKMSVPTARSCPNAELPLRINELIGSDSTTVVVNCAGRTRSIIGAENLRSLGLPNPIFALENGTQGWVLADLELNHGLTPEPLPMLSKDACAGAIRAARLFQERYGIPTVDDKMLAELRAADGCLYLLDVRSAEEYQAARVPGSVHAPGGQLVQATDQWVAVRGAKIVLIDDLSLRAYVTARWLRGMGHDAYVAVLPESSFSDSGVNALEPLAAIAEMGIDATVGHTLVDLSSGMLYREAHLAGALWGIRPRLQSLDILPETPVCLIGDDPGVAGLAARELDDLGFQVSGFLRRDVERWRDAGSVVESTPDSPADAACIDYLFFVHDRHDGNLDAAREYLAWETGLIARMDEQERSIFKPK